MNLNKTYLLTGGTGSFGKSYVKNFLKKNNRSNLIIYSRDEMKQWDMGIKYKNHKNIKFIIGDVRDAERLCWASKGVDYIIHAAATKIVTTAEFNPSECIQTNIDGANNVIKAARLNKVKRVVALSTDKACNPVNLYGATKLVSDKLFVAANISKKIDTTSYSVVRYGNVLGSRGSIIPFFLSLNNKQSFPITDNKMTRFLISLEDAVSLVDFAFKDMRGGEIYVKKIPSVKITDIAFAIDPKRKQKIIGIRPGEKLHEQMINEEDSYYTYEYKGHYKILTPLNDFHKDPGRIKNGRKVKLNFSYNSESNKDWIKLKTLRNLISNFKLDE